MNRSQILVGIQSRTVRFFKGAASRKRKKNNNYNNFRTRYHAYMISFLS